MVVFDSVVLTLLLNEDSDVPGADFDVRAAIELAEITKTALAGGDKKSGVDAPWQRIKLDRQIVAIAKTAGARRLYTNDGNMTTFATMAGIEVVPIHAVPLPPADPQLSMELVAPPRPTAEDEPDEAEIDIAAELDTAEEREDDAH